MKTRPHHLRQRGIGDIWRKEATIPRDGSNVYSPPAGTTATSGTTIESAKYNAFVADITSDLNLARPVSVGGTGVSTVAAAQGVFKIAPYDGAANISGTWEWQDDVGAVFGNDADASISWVSADSALTMSIGATAIFEVKAAGVDVTGNGTVSGDLAVTGETETGTFGTTAVAQIDLRAKLTLATKQTTTSGSTIDFTGIPAGVTEIYVMFNGVSTNGTDNFIVQLGDSGGFETSGYVSASSNQSSGTGSTSGFAILRTDASTITSGLMTLRLMDAAAFTWVSSHAVGAGGENAAGGGSKSLSAELTQVRITVPGSDTFDAGEINISYR